MLQCLKCNKIKDRDKFRIQTSGRINRRCKVCVNKQARKQYYKNKSYWEKYYLDNKETLIEKGKIYRKNNKEERAQYAKEYEKRNKEVINEKKAKRAREDINYKLKTRLRTRVYIAIKIGQKSGSTVEDLGCSVEFLKEYLESKFQPGMTWDNWSKDGWHIDHIIPLASFNLTNREEFLKACHYTNLQPLWAEDNLSKGSK